MTHQLDRRGDGSLALHIDGDLQFLQYAYSGNGLPARSGVLWDGLAFHKDIAPLPPADEERDSFRRRYEMG